jgi:hypothetical protein
VVFPLNSNFFFVMPDLVPGIHVLPHDAEIKTWMAGTIGERSDAVLRTAWPGHDASFKITISPI